MEQETFSTDRADAMSPNATPDNPETLMWFQRAKNGIKSFCAYHRPRTGIRYVIPKFHSYLAGMKKTIGHDVVLVAL